MSIKVKLKEDEQNKTEDVEVTELEKSEEITDEEIVEEDSSKKLELENARLQGQLEVLKSTPKPDKVDQNERARLQLLNDANNLSDEQFEAVYKATKSQTMTVFLDQQLRLNKQETSQRIFESEAKMELTNKYGKDFTKYKKELNECLEDASPAVRQDPERLTRFLERNFLALSKDDAPAEKKQVVKKEEDMQRRRIVSDFAKPGVDGSDLKKNEDPNKDVIKEEYKGLGSRWGIETESERKKYLGKVVYVPMNFGNGVTFSDPKKGFESNATASEKKKGRRLRA